LEVNANVPIAPTTIYLESITVSGNSLIEPVSIFVCGFETFSLTDAAPYTDTIEVFSGEHLIDTSAFFTNSLEDICPTNSYALKMDAAGTEDLNTTLASIFAINSVTGEVVYQSTPTPVTGTVTIYAIVRTESGVTANREISIEFKYDMA
jgi:hypothetical protein